jgi:hypothetical protein
MRTPSRSDQKSLLQLRLGAWDGIATQPGGRTDRRSRNWLLYTTAVGSALAMTTDAGAQIIYHSGSPVTLKAPLLGGTSSAPIPIGPGFDLQAALFTSFGFVGLAGHGNAKMLLSGSVVRRLSSGAKISGGSSAFGPGQHYVKAANTSGGFQTGAFAASQPGFAGIEFNTGGRGTSYFPALPELHYGWIRLVYDGIPLSGSITAIDWAYDLTPNEAVTAGQTTSVQTDPTPEPGTAALSLLAMGAAGILAWRRRKSALTVK